MYGCQKNLINPNAELKAIIEFICSESNKLANCGIYYARQLYFKTGKIPNKAKLHRLLKYNPHFQSLYSHVAQQTLTNVAESFSSFVGLLKGIAKGNIEQRPRLPGYKKNSFKTATFPKADIKLKDNLLRFPLGRKVKAWFNIDAFYLPMPSNLEFKDIKEIRVLPRNRCFYAEFVYEVEDQKVEVNSTKVLGIDHGIDNWLTCVSNCNTSFIVDGRHLKSLNQWYNKQTTAIKEGKPQGFWSQKLATITEKRNRQIRDAINKAARLVINHCIQNKIGNVVFGWNQRQKDGLSMGAKTNQKFVQIPTGRLKDRIAQLCKQYGIQFIETEESYTSITSFLDKDVLPVFGAKPEGWKASGKRVKRGLYRSALNWCLNADANAAANIIRKVATTLKVSLEEVSRGALITPLRVRLWTLKNHPTSGG